MSYRFNNSTARWKGLEKTFDESIDYSLRTVDQMCFSSQFYFIGIGGTGSFLFVLAMSMMLRAQYNMFEDILFGLVVAITLGLCVIAQEGVPHHRRHHRAVENLSGADGRRNDSRG